MNAAVNGSGHIEDDHEDDAVSRLEASFFATINPHTFIFSNKDVEKETLIKISNVALSISLQNIF